MPVDTLTNRIINVGWLPSLKMKKFRVPSLKIRKFRVISISCFLQEMKFIFKLGCCLIMKNVSFSIPHLRKNIFQNIESKNTKNQDTNERKSKKIWYLGHTDFDKFRNFLCPRLTKLISFQDDSIIFLVFFVFYIYFWIYNS